ncbi:ATP-binding protein [Pseudomonas massiliensis]|uniref:ATP-binding protein n=1 Tax=Pseudomonas massiliensis TaxID=522492 RepID=UPI000693886B|nr:ATP-binding protein [Pseudomonas massiliensis]
MTAKPQGGDAWRETQGCWPSEDMFDGGCRAGEGVLVCAAPGPDRDQLCAQLAEGLAPAYRLIEPAELYLALERGAQVLLTTSETLACGDLAPLQAWLDNQPEWSDLPVLVLTAATGGRRLPPPPSLAGLGNVRLLQRPYHPASLEILLDASLQGRDRQYRMRAKLMRMQADDGGTEPYIESPSRLEAVGRLTGGIAQDFNNLLTGVLGGLDMIRRCLNTGQYGRLDSLLDLSTHSAQRAAQLTHRLLAFARRQRLDAQELDINRLIENGLGLFSRSLNSSIALQFRPMDNLWPVYLDPSQLESALLNLIINAGDAMPGGGRLLIDTTNRTLATCETAGSLALPAGDYVVIGVQDDGCGMNRETLERAFDPFFTTKPAGLGTGLGLSMVYGFARQSAGYVTLHSEPSRGSRVELYFPKA